jgi:hypothetical protein
MKANVAAEEKELEQRTGEPAKPKEKEAKPATP